VKETQALAQKEHKVTLLKVSESIGCNLTTEELAKLRKKMRLCGNGGMQQHTNQKRSEMNIKSDFKSRMVYSGEGKKNRAEQ